MKELDKKAVVWKIVTLASGTAAGLVTERVLVVVWDKAFSRIAPTNIADRRTSWAAALSWAVATGVGVGVARLVANRSAAAVWEAATDEVPPGMQTGSAS